MSDKPQLHSSHLNMLSRCGVQFQRRYGATFGVGDRNEILRPGIPLAIGSAVHSSIELHLKRKVEGEETSLDHVEAVARDTFQEKWTDGIDLNEVESVAPKVTRADSVDMTVALARLHFTDVAPRIQPIAVEKPFVIQLDNMPVDLSGRIDIVTADGIRDSKTSGKKPSPGVLLGIQPRMYCQAHKLETKEFPETFSLDYLIKTKVPKAESISIKPDEDFVRPLFARIERAVEIIESVKAGRQAFAPANEDHWICTAKFCGYARTCKFWSGR